MRRSTFVLSVLSLCIGLSNPAQADGPISLTIDVGNVETTLALLGDAPPTEEQIQAFLDEPGTAALLRKVRDRAPEASEDDLVEALKAARRGERRPDPALLNYYGVAARKDEIHSLAQGLTDQEAELGAFLNEHLAVAVPEGESIELRLTVVSGGPSIGWTFGDSDTQYMGLHFMRGDFAAVQQTLLHETAHNIHALSYDMDAARDMLAEDDRPSFQILRRIVEEGLADYIDSLPDYGPGPHPKIEELETHAAHNRGRVRQIEELIDHAVLTVTIKPDKSELFQRVLMDWAWNNPGYYYGQRIADALAERGRDPLDYLHEPPTRFFIDCARTADATEGGLCAGFSDEFLGLLERLDAELSGGMGRE